MNYIKIGETDNVAVALCDLKCGSEALGVTLREDIPAGHKFALTTICQGENIIKYSSPIGQALKDIAPGEWIHTHNIKTNLSGVLEYTYTPKEIPEKEGRTATFRGFRRSDGKVGIRNEIWIIPTVGCVNSVAEEIAHASAAYAVGSVDGVFAMTHPFGCSQLGGDHLNTQKALAGLAHHPNAGGVLILGLGCENNNLDEFRRVLGVCDPERIRFLNAQDVEDEIAEGTEIVRALCEIASHDERVDIPSSELVVGLKCGGSDGFSGITANPTVGVFSDMLIYGGGSAVLTEVPEMFGAETLLMERCETRETFDMTVSLINNFKEYFMRYNQPVYENPSPGNKKGGISTLEEKSLGCIQKGGLSKVVDVLDYGDTISKNGLSLLNGPGNDIVAITNLTAAGVHMILFTTGRGTPVGAPVPTVKIATNHSLATRKTGWIDFDASGTLEGNPLTDELFEFIIKVAEGEQTKNEINSYREISIFKDGVTL